MSHESAAHRTPTILVIEDDAPLRELVASFLRAQGFTVMAEGDGARGLATLLRERPTLVVLDWMLPSLMGVDVLRSARATYRGAVVVLTANKAQIDEVVGLELGADDYVTKPVEPRILLARIRSVLRRYAPDERVVREEVRVGSLVLWRSSMRCSVGEAPVELTASEFGLVVILAEHAGEVVTRDELSRRVLGVAYDGVDRSIDVHVSRIRKKLESAGLDRDAIRSIRAAGYLLVRG